MKIGDLGTANRSVRCSECRSDGTVPTERSHVQSPSLSVTSAQGYALIMAIRAGLRQDSKDSQCSSGPVLGSWD